MNFIEFKHWWDFGREFRLRLLTLKRFSVFNLAIHHSDYFDWREVNLYVTVNILGHYNLFKISLNVWNVTVDLSIFDWYSF